MDKPEIQKGKSRDAQKTREAILDAAEVIFSQHGFEGARIDTIAKASGYNTGLIFRYFGDKLGLYTEMIKRADKEVSGLISHAFAPLLEDETAAADGQWVKSFLKTMIQTFFDYLLEHPRLTRILTWEMADGWTILNKITSQLPAGNSGQFEIFFNKAWKAGLLRSDFIPKIQFSMIFQMCQIYLASLPVYQILLPGEDLSAVEAFTRAREYIVNFIVAGIMKSADH